MKSKRKTKEQKKRAMYHYALPANKSFTNLESDQVSQTSVKQTFVPESLYTYDPIYISSDLKKTLFFSIIILLLQIALYLNWK